MRNLLPLLLIPALATADPDHTPAPFAAQLDGKVATAQAGNFVFSPASITLALELARAGAKGQTAAQLDRVLGVTATAALERLMAAPEPGNRQDPTLAIANRIYAERTQPFLKDYLERTHAELGADAATVDFIHASDAARDAINKWVATQTHDKIKDLLSPAAVNDRTRAVLVNAIYLKAQWLAQFSASATRPDKFIVAGAGAEQVPTMHGTATAKTGSHDSARLLDLPYYSAKGPRLSMLIVIPENRTLPLVEADYAREGLAPFIAAAATNERLAVALPKFETGTRLDLKQPLEALGITDAFDDKTANFSGMSAHRMVISKVVHQAWIKVDEAGTEAAAATAVVMVNATAVEEPPRPFAVDRSFLFFVHDDQGNVLFAGRVLDPSKA